MANNVSARSKIAIVATMRDIGPSIGSWVSYHAKMVDRLYIFLDGGDSKDFKSIPFSPKVHVFSGVDHSTMSGCNGVMERQVGNVNRAMEVCKEDGIDWLFHIDSDELIWSPAENLADYFDRQPQEVSTISFDNHEVLQTSDHVEDCFRQLHFFKRNSGAVPFKFYGNGKSAIRIERYAAANGVHLFHTLSGTSKKENTVSILHYPCPTYHDWLKKYERLGVFSSFWYENSRMPVGLQYHLDSRDAYQESLKTGDWKIAEEFYNKSLLTRDQIARWMKSDAIFFADPLASKVSHKTQEPALINLINRLWVLTEDRHRLAATAKTREPDLLNLLHRLRAYSAGRHRLQATADARFSHQVN